jgi:multidrug efflux pump subunit AcrA (membrane-fusion protein)
MPEGLKKNKLLPIHEIRSAEMQDVMSVIPGSILKWGLMLLFGIIISILAVSWFIYYPDVVIAPVTLTTYNAPASLVARSGGIISQMFVKNEESVNLGQPIALIHNQAEWNDILKLETLLNSLKNEDNLENFARGLSMPKNLNLGEIQGSYLRLLTLSDKLKEYLHQAFIPQKIDILRKQVIRQEEYIMELNNQLLLSEEDMKLTLNSYRRDSDLFHRSSYSISVNEFERSKQALIQKQIVFSNLKSNIKNNETSILKLEESSFDLNNQFVNEINSFKSDLAETIQLLDISIKQWKDKYLISSTTTGKITFTSFWNVNQVIKEGDPFATVIPADPEKIIVRAKVPVSGSGKVKKKQEVNIKLSGFPYMEFGVIKGIVYSISMVPVEDSYIVEIALVEGMKSTYNKEIKYINEMTGTAEIITEKRRLIFKFLKPLNALNKSL